MIKWKVLIYFYLWIDFIVHYQISIVFFFLFFALHSGRRRLLGRIAISTIIFVRLNSVGIKPALTAFNCNRFRYRRCIFVYKVINGRFQSAAPFNFLTFRTMRMFFHDERRLVRPKNQSTFALVFCTSNASPIVSTILSIQIIIHNDQWTATLTVNEVQTFKLK